MELLRMTGVSRQCGGRTLLWQFKAGVDFPLNWLQVLGRAEPPQIDERVGHQLHAIVPTLMVLEPQQQPLEFVLPGKRPLDAVP